eukprot:CAMPEP_0170605676 /NCGR_PEP_ID=MMETSP0224-20130122/20100_1 /TAXON_ID=285029 /ORGANISM="Togula jolla, Strain CCCM 725" /LENGTH=301 /DNA_ID=CAMNT_0010930695 /DNA_START=33 /DNA_END=938 /DNA_ORIENTATION=-
MAPVEEPEDGAAAKGAEDAKGKPDEPIVVELKALDDKYLELARQCQKEIQAVERKFAEQQRPLLEQRTTLLVGNSGEEVGTPALSSFWLTAMKNHPAFEDYLQEWDEPVLEYLRDITTVNLDENDPNSGFRLEFKFVENPYFTDTTLWKEYHSKESSPYTQEIEPEEIKASSINWKPGKDVTVEIIRKKVKGGGAKKAKASKEKEEPRESFFRIFFKDLRRDMPMPEDIPISDGGSDEEDEEELMMELMDSDYEAGCAMRDEIIPYAIRWYTGEAAPEESDEESESEGGGSSDEESDEDAS